MAKKIKALGFGQKRLVEEIIKETYRIDNPAKIKLGLNDILYIIQEMNNNEGMKYVDGDDHNRGFNIFKMFAKHLLYRNLANYDTMILLTSEKGAGKSSAAIMLARELCKLMGIRFNPDRHLAYNNKDVMEKIDKLNTFEPLICDEAVRFACLEGDTLIHTNKGKIKIKELVNKKDIKILSYNKQNNSLQYKKAQKCIEVKTDTVYEIETECGNKIKATEDHKFLTKNGEWKKLKELKEGDDLALGYRINNITKLNDQKVYDILNVEDNNNYIANNFVVHNSSADWAKCIDEDSIIQLKNKKVKIKDLVNKTNFEVLSFNEKNKKYEYKIAEKCMKIKTDTVYEIETICGKKIKATKEHKFLTTTGWKTLKELKEGTVLALEYIIKNIKKIGKKQVYDIINVKDNNNYVANDFVVHNSESKTLKKKLAEVRTKHLFFILCFPLKISKIEKNYLDSFVNYWVSLYARGYGGIFVKDKNPSNDPWRLKDFKHVGSYTEFTAPSEVEKKLKKHPNFWRVIKFPKVPDWLYEKYLKVREKNVYEEDIVRASVTSEDIYKSLLLLALQDIMMNDAQLTMNRITLHIKNNYDIPIAKRQISQIMTDAKQMVMKIREEQVSK